jgi:hypothetical protein
MKSWLTATLKIQWGQIWLRKKEVNWGIAHRLGTEVL